MPFEDEGGNWGDESTSHGTPEVANIPPEAGEAWNRLPACPQKEVYNKTK